MSKTDEFIKPATQSEIIKMDDLDAIFSGRQVVFCISDIVKVDEDGTEWVKNNLHEIPFSGKVMVKRGGYKSKVVENATWEQIALLADESIEKLDDYDHVFLEKAWVSGIRNGVKIIELFMGS